MAPPPPLPDALDARLRVVRLLGRGGFGEVFEVEDRSTGERSALKLISLDEPARAHRELEAAARVQHPHLLPTLETGTAGGRAFLRMPVAQGSLDDLLAAARPEDGPRCWDLLRQAGRGLAALHRAGIVHRDLKPANVLILEGRAVVADFGLAKGVDLGSLTATGVLLGTPAYMAPEQARGEPAVPASDAWALGCMAREVLTRQPPRDLPPQEQLMRRARGEGGDLGPHGEGLPAHLRAAVVALLQARPEDRPRDLEAWADEVGPLPSPQSPEPAAPTQVVPGRAGAATARTQRSPRPPGGAEDPTPRRLDPPPSEAGRGPSPRPWLTGLATTLVLVAAFGWSAVNAPTRPPVTPDAATAMPPLDAPANQDAGQLARQLEDATAFVLTPDGQVLEEFRGTLPDGAYPLLDDPPDPTHFGELVAATPVLATELERWRAGLRVEELTEAERRRLTDLDAVLARRGLPRLFGPLLDLRPGPPTGPHPRVDRHLEHGFTSLGSPLPRQDGWLGVAIGLAEGLLARRAELDAQLAASERDPSAGPEVLRQLWAGFDRALRIPQWPRILEKPFYIYRSRGLRQLYPSWTRADDDLRRLLYAMGRTLEGPPPDREALAYLTLGWSGGLRPLSYGPTFDLDPRTWTADRAPSAASARLHATLLDWRVASLRDAFGDPTPLRHQQVELLSRASRDAADDPVARHRRQISKADLMALYVDLGEHRQALEVLRTFPVIEIPEGMHGRHTLISNGAQVVKALGAQAVGVELLQRLEAQARACSKLREDTSFGDALPGIHASLRAALAEVAAPPR